MDNSHPAVMLCVDDVLDLDASSVKNSLRLYYWVQDDIRYNPYGFDLTPGRLTASEFDNAGNRHMQYLHDRGKYLDVPLEEMTAVFNDKYRSALGGPSDKPSVAPDASQWEQDIADEARKN